METKKVVLEVRNLCKSFGEHLVHDNVSFCLYEGEGVGLLGTSGAGKSVLLRALVGLVSPDSGEILFKGKRIDQNTEKEWDQTRLQISYSFQNGALFDSLSVGENLAFPLENHTSLSTDEIDQRIHSYLKMIGLEGIQDLYPVDLSGGMQKRVGMARSLILSPSIVLYDEPTAGLDPENCAKIVNLMKKLQTTERSSIFITHDIPSALKFCDRLLILHEKKIYFEGTPKDFLHSDDPVLRSFIEHFDIFLEK